MFFKLNFKREQEKKKERILLSDLKEIEFCFSALIYM